MLTIPDLKQKQILFVNTFSKEGEKKLRFENDHIVYEINGKIINRVSSQKALAVFIVGHISITTGFLEKSIKNGASIFFMSPSLNVYAQTGVEAEANYLLRARQYHLTEEQELTIAKHIVFNKFLNQKYLLEKKQKKHRLENELKKRIEGAEDFNVLLGIEGNFSKEFFKNYFVDIDWWRREPRTKQDIPNLLLDIGYTILFNMVDSFLRLHGFDTYKGVYHKLFFARKSLVCDMVEPLRCLIDKQLLKSYNLKQVDRKDFVCSKGVFSLKIDKNKKYTHIFSKTLMENKENIYDYIQKYYRYTMDSEKYNIPSFKINE